MKLLQFSGGRTDTYKMADFPFPDQAELPRSLDLNQPFDSPNDPIGDPIGDHGDEAQPAQQRRRKRSDRLVSEHLNPRNVWEIWLKRLIVFLVVAAIAHEIYASYYDRKMTEAIREVSGQQELEVHCRRVWDEVLDFRVKPGFVWFGSGVANLQLNVCRDAAGWASDQEDEDKRVAVMVLTHELAHLAGHHDESLTECVAMWTAPKTAAALGARPEDGASLAQWYATNYNPLLPAAYYSPGCLDRSPPDSPLLR